MKNTGWSLKKIIRDYKKTKEYHILDRGLDTAKKAIDKDISAEEEKGVNTDLMNINTEVFERVDSE